MGMNFCQKFRLLSKPEPKEDMSTPPSYARSTSQRHGLWFKRVTLLSKGQACPRDPTSQPTGRLANVYWQVRPGQMCSEGRHPMTSHLKVHLRPHTPCFTRLPTHVCTVLCPAASAGSAHNPPNTLRFPPMPP